MKRHHLYLLFLPALIILLLNSCGSGSSFSNLSESTRFLLRSDSGLFRGVHSDMSLSEVKAHEKAKLVEEDENYIYYTLEGQSLDGKAELEYFFAGQGRLDMIISTITLYNQDNWKQMKDGLTSYYDSRFKKHKENKDGQRIWEFPAPRGQDGSIEVLLKSKSDEDAYTLTLEIMKYYQY